jgi:hypothetical protein
MDADYGRNRDGEPTKAFEPSLFVWATVMSRPAEDRAIVDAGLKALAFDPGPPLVCDEPAATYERASGEHGRLAVSAATNRLALGDKLRLIPGHCDQTVNLYDWVCPRARKPRRAGLADHRLRGCVLTVVPRSRLAMGGNRLSVDHNNPASRVRESSPGVSISLVLIHTLLGPSYLP